MGGSIYRGTIKWFDSRPEKNYGFVVCEGFADSSESCPIYGEEFFFHYNDGEFLAVGEEGATFSGLHYELTFGGTRVLSHPKPGDTIVFQLGVGRNGKKKALPWGYRNQYQRPERSRPYAEAR